MPRLIAQSSELAGQVFELNEAELTVGRLDDNAIPIPHSSVSGHHAILRLDDKDYIVQDLGSTNGTRVNGERVTEQKLRRNDLLRVGNIELFYDSEHAPPGRPLPEQADRINLSACFSAGRASNFVNASPVPKMANTNKLTRWSLILALLYVLAIASVGFFIYEVLVVPMM